ncbi:MAG: ABC transporter substrate-binding protein [Polyangiaceae bacterium]|nr:ABC transporter substrate-binding protein [Polyangiaceae bacterium]
MPEKTTRRALLSGLAALAACKDAGGSKGPIERIVSTSPSTTEMVFAVGRGDSLVGRSSFCDYPPEAQKIEVIGGFSNPNLERILALRPDLVCGERGPSWPGSIAPIEQAGIRTFFPPIDRVSDVSKAIEELGALLDRRDRALEVTRAITGKIEAVKRLTESETRVRTVMLFDWKPLVAAGPGSFPDEVIALAGGENLVKSGGQYPKLSVEGLITLDPDLVIDGSAGAYPEGPEVLVATIPGLSALRAAKSGKLRRLEGTSAIRPGPRIGEGVETVARLLYPERFASP